MKHKAESLLEVLKPQYITKAALATSQHISSNLY